MKTSTLALAAAALSSPAAAVFVDKQCNQTITATFDDFNGTLGVYHGLNWPAMQTARAATGLLGWLGRLGADTLVAHSGASVAVFDAASTRAFSSPGMTMYYSGTRAARFALKTLYMGCASNEAGAVGAPVNCTVQVQGTSAVNNGYRQKNLTYVAGADRKMALFDFTGAKNQDWANLGQITFQVISDEGLLGTSAPMVAFDDVQYTAYTYC